MASKNTSIPDDVYRRLAEEKREGESFGDVIDRLLKGRPLSEFASSLDGASEGPTVTPASAAGVWVGAYLVSEGERAAAAALLESLTRLDLSLDSVRTAGEIQACLRRRADGIGFLECLRAATAIEHVEPLLTRDSDFERIAGLALVSN